MRAVIPCVKSDGGPLTAPPRETRLGPVSMATESVARLADTGHRLTATRRAVLDAIARSPRPFTIEELSARLPHIGRATVFRTVKLLSELELVCRLPLEDGGVRYQRAGSGEHHHHLICGGCGTVAEFSDPALDDAIERNAAVAGFALDAHSAELYGRCASCRA